VELLSHTPALAKLFLLQGQALITSINLSARQRQIIILTVGVLTECEYELTQHTPISESVGVTGAQREALRRQDFSNPALTPEDHALIHFVEETLQIPRVSDATFDRLRLMFTDRQIVETIQIAGAYWAFARICTTVDIEVQQATDLTSVEAPARLTP
jgi:alkylhydroperoxidase family enzyme